MHTMEYFPPQIGGNSDTQHNMDNLEAILLSEISLS
jgi:hypothetical protein